MTTAQDSDTARIDIGILFSAIWRHKVRITLVTLGLLVLTYGVLLFVPKMYESSASILVEPRNSTYLTASNGTNSDSIGTSVSDDMAIASQIQLIQSRDTLVSVIKSDNLSSVPELTAPPSGVFGVLVGLFGKAPKADITDTILANMDSRLSVVREQNSRVITILFRSESPALAAKIANDIAKTHVNRRAGLTLSDTADATKWLETEIDKLRKRVAAAEAKVANFRIQNDLYTGKDGNSSLVDQQLSDIAAQITQSQERQSTALSRAAVLRSLIKAGKPIDSVPAVQDSAVIQALAQQKSDLQGKKAELLARLLPNHPDVLAVGAQISEINAQMAAEGRRIADALEAEAKIEAGIESSLRDKLTQLKASASSDLTNGVTLAELEREAKAERDLLETYLVRYRDASARTDVNSALPDVRVVTEAAPSYIPVSPKTALIMIAVLVVSLAGQIGYVLFGELVSGRAIVEDEEFASAPVAAAAPPPDFDEAEPDPIDAVMVLAPDAAPSAVERSEPTRWEQTEETEAVAEPEDTAEVVGDTAEAENISDAEDGADLEQPAGAAAVAEPLEPVARIERVERIVSPEPKEASAQSAVSPVRSSQYVSPQQTTAPRSRRTHGLPQALKPLIDALAAGKEQVVFVGSLGDPSYAQSIVEQLGASCAALGLGVATIDAASGKPSANLGLGDLLCGAASFGDVVHADRAGHLARVPWGRQAQLDHRSAHGVTLAEALSDIYHVVLIATGLPGINSSLPVFAGAGGFVVIASDRAVDEGTFSGLEAGAGALGFNRVQIVCADDEVQVA